MISPGKPGLFSAAWDMERKPTPHRACPRGLARILVCSPQDTGAGHWMLTLSFHLDYEFHLDYGDELSFRQVFYVL